MCAYLKHVVRFIKLINRSYKEYKFVVRFLKYEKTKNKLENSVHYYSYEILCLENELVVKIFRITVLMQKKQQYLYT